jgi:ADP-heptose:LPS heptosyltransferase
MNVLIVKLSSLGDVLHALPAVQALRDALPEAHLGWAVDRAFAGLLRGQPWLDEVLEWDRKGSKSLATFVWRLRMRDWDVAIDLQGLFRSGLVARLSGARRRIGAWQSRELAWLFYNERVRHSTTDVHAVDRLMELVAPLGAKSSLVPVARPYVLGAWPSAEVPSSRVTGPALFPLQPSDQDRSAVELWLSEQGFVPHRDRLIVLNAHCRRDANLWPAQSFAALAKRLLALPNTRVALTGGPIARELNDSIAAAVGPQLWRADSRFSLLGSALLFAEASVFVTGDTGPMHIAAAVGAPIVALLGATSPNLTGPYAADAVVLHKRISCSPCLAKRCPLNTAPSPCMEAISVDDALAAVVRRLEEANDRQWRRSA